MLGDGALAFREFAMREPVPLAHVQETVLGYLRHRKDAVLFGAQAVNAYVDEPRMTQDVDILASRAKELAEELRERIATRHGIAVRIRAVREGAGYRIYQLRKPKNRHLVDVRSVESLPPAHTIEDIQVLAPPFLVAMKIVALLERRGRPKAGTDWRDLASLLLTFPDLRLDPGPVRASLESLGAPPEAFSKWATVRSEKILPEDDDEGF